MKLLQMHIHERTYNDELYTKIYSNLIYTSEKYLSMNIQAEFHGQRVEHMVQARHVPHLFFLLFFFFYCLKSWIGAVAIWRKPINRWFHMIYLQLKIILTYLSQVMATEDRLKFHAIDFSYQLIEENIHAYHIRLPFRKKKFVSMNNHEIYLKHFRFDYPRIRETLLSLISKHCVLTKLV